MKNIEKINVRKESGATTALVIFTIIMIVTILSGIYFVINQRAMAQLRNDEKIEEIYSREVLRADEIYDELVSKLHTVPNTSIIMTNSTDHLFSIKSEVNLLDGNEGDNAINCKYVYTNSAENIGTDANLYTDGTITRQREIIETVKGPGTYYLHVLTADKAGTPIEIVSTNSVTVAETADFNYTGNVQTASLLPGTYKMECWGAEGGKGSADGVNYIYVGGKGAYTSGKTILNQSKKIYIYVGGKGADAAWNFEGTSLGGYNGGGTGGYDEITTNASDSGGGGGGATDIRLTNGNWNDFESLKSRIMVAAAGGGGSWNSTTTSDGQNGGGLYTKNLIINGANDSRTPVTDGTQTSGYKFGIGMNRGIASGTGAASGGGAGGYYTGYLDSDKKQGPGGSSFISGHNGCDAISETSTESNIVNTGQSSHYSGLVFTETKMIDGAGYAWTNIKGNQEQMPNPAGGKYALGTGHTGNGFARITNMN